MKKELLYIRIASQIEHQINTGILRAGDKLPSLRNICREYGVSQSTALQAYGLLESRSFIRSRPQSGYFVDQLPSRLLPIPHTSEPHGQSERSDTEELSGKVYHHLNDDNYTVFSLAVPADELLPVAKLNKGLITAMRNLTAGGVGYEAVQGSEKLRRQIARQALPMQANLDHRNLVITDGCINAIALCLMATTQRGDTIALESPVSFGILQLAQSLGLQVMELPTHAETGVVPEALKAALEKGKVTVCLLMSNFNNPMGSRMPDEHKKEAARLMEKHNVPLIENDLNGDLYFGAHRPVSCKSFDESGMVLWCGSVSKTLAPGYRVGWVDPGKFKAEVLKLKRYHSIASPAITQEAIAGFLETGRYENHLRRLRHILQANHTKYLQAISDHFPEGTMASRPQGGSVLWLELDKRIDTLELYERAIRQKISIAPGKLFTLQNQFNNCLRLNYGLVWNDKIENALKMLGKLARGINM